VTPEFGSTSRSLRQAELLSELGAGTPTSAEQIEWSELTKEKSQSTSAQLNLAGTIADQWANANQPALKIGVRKMVGIASLKLR
jgi:hypothetical protein